jgi:preprotein translocase subunit SecF
MKNKILIGLAIVILVGAILVAAVGFNVDASYKGYTLIDINIGQEFNINDIKAITDEVFGKSKVEIQKAGEFNDNVAIKVSEVTDEQKELLNNKINEKYGTENTLKDMKVNYIPRFRLIDVVKPYIVPLITATLLILVYMAIRFRKLGVGKVLTQAIALPVIAELLYFALIAITRYPVNRLLMPVAVVIYITILTVLTGMFEKQLKTEEK